MNERQFHVFVGIWLQEHGYEFQHEVGMPDFGRADFVAKDQQGQTWVIECKVGGNAKDGRSIIQLMDYCRQLPGSKGLYAIPAQLRAPEIDALCHTYGVTVLPISIETPIGMTDVSTIERDKSATRRGSLGESIQQTAYQQLRQNGIHAVSLRAIAKELNISAPAIYRYYPTLEDLHNALTDYAAQLFVAALENTDRAVAVDNYSGRLRAVLKEYYQWTAQHPHEFHLIFAKSKTPYESGSLTLPPAHRILEVFIHIINSAVLTGSIDLGEAHDQADNIRADYLLTLEKRRRYRVSPAVVTVAMHVWSGIYGLMAMHRHPIVPFFHDLPETFYDEKIEALVLECRFKTQTT